jgi:hypothetical protein
MKNVLCSVALMVALGLCLAAPLSAQTEATTGQQQDPSDLAKKVEDLTQLVKQLQAELATVKRDAQPAAQPAHPRNTIEVASLSAPPVVPDAAPQDPAPAAPEKISLSSLLGPTTLSGFVDVFYGYNSNQPAGRRNAFHNFDMNSSEIGLNMIELVADKAVSSDSRIGYHIALGFGQAMNQINATDVGPGGTEPNFAQNLKEGYLSYLAPIGKGLQINVGKFVTPAGAELIETKDNWNYTRGLLFALAIPYFHEGVSAKYAFNSKFALTGYLVNGWNNTVETNSGKTTGFSASFTPSSKFAITQNYLVGPEVTDDNSNYRHLSDTVVTFSPTSKLSLMANYDYGHDRPGGTPVWWSGIAGYVKYAPNDKWAFAGRGEWFEDHDGFATGTPDNKMTEFTLTAQRLIAGKLLSRLEFRRDMSNNDIFPYRTGLFRDNQNTVTVGLVYAFSSADAK